MLPGWSAHWSAYQQHRHRARLPTGRQVATQQRLDCLKWQWRWERRSQPLLDAPFLQQSIHGARKISPRAVRHLKLIEPPFIGDPNRQCQRATIAPIDREQQQRNQRQQGQSDELARKK
jgi:hypothetical protein